MTMSNMAALVASVMLALPVVIEAGKFPDFYSFSDIDEDWPRG